MSWYLIVWHESDGNDCTVFDTIVEALSKEDALDALAEALERQMDANGTGYQDGGNHLDYTFDCPADCDGECDGHGGTSLREVSEHATEKDAQGARSRWHSEWTIPELDIEPPDAADLGEK